MKKAMVIASILLCIGLCCLPMTAMGKTWVYAHLDGNIDGLPSDAVTWDSASPQNSFIKWRVINLHLNASKGNGTLTIKPLARPEIQYDFPTDFTSLKIVCIYNYLGGVIFKQGTDDEYDFTCRGHGLFVEIN